MNYKRLANNKNRDEKIKKENDLSINCELIKHLFRIL